MTLPKALQDEKTMTGNKPVVWLIGAERSKLYQETFSNKQYSQKLLQVTASSASIESFLQLWSNAD